MILKDLGLKYSLESEITAKSQKTTDMNLLNNYNSMRTYITFLNNYKCQCHSPPNTFSNIHEVLN